MTPLLYSIAFLGCSSAPEPVTTEELSQFEANTWTLEQITKDIQESYANEDWKRLGAVLFSIKTEDFHTLEPMLFQLYSESPPASQRGHVEGAIQNSYRNELRRALLAHHSDPIIIARFMSHQGLSHKKCAQILDTRRKNLDHSSQVLFT